MKVLVLYEYPPNPAGLATQGDLLYRGLLYHGVDVFPVNLNSDIEKEWYYRWFKPDVVVGVGYWGHLPQIVLHPQKFGQLAIPWLVADGYIANYHAVLNSLPMILVTSNWVKTVYNRDGINTDRMFVLPVGCETDIFCPRPEEDSSVQAVRAILGIKPGELFILTIGGDAASKGAREVIQALARVKTQIPSWKYICKVWQQTRTTIQNEKDQELIEELGLSSKVSIIQDMLSRNIMPYLMNACDIYAAPSRLEGFGMPHVEANSSGRPVISVAAMAMLDTMVHGETAYLARVEEEIVITETRVGMEAGFPAERLVTFDTPRVVEYRASIDDIAAGLIALASDKGLRDRMGDAGRKRVQAKFDYRVVAGQFIQLIKENFGITA